MRSDFWNDREEASKIIDSMNKLKSVIDPIDLLYKKIKDNIDMLDVINDNDFDLLQGLESDYQDCKNSLEDLKIQTYLSGKYDSNNCLLEIHSGAGGTEACDWANMLYRMYMRYFDKCHYKAVELSRQDGEEVGIKSVLVKVIGNNAYGYLKHEKGVHRLVRISPFDANKRRHTSFASVEVIPEFNNDIQIYILEKKKLILLIVLFVLLIFLLVLWLLVRMKEVRFKIRNIVWKCLGVSCMLWNWRSRIKKCLI